ncbi:cation:proton antiporter regulatory subunit [soil metagenome]
MDLVETLLPGVGIRYEMTTRSGAPLAFVVRRDGAVEVSVYDTHDRDRARSAVRLDADEAATIAEVLGAPRITQRFADLSREVPGLQSARLAVEPGSTYVDRPLGDTRARTRTGCSIVAVVRGEQVVTSPSPQETLRARDVLVVIGSAEGLDALATLLATA